MPGPQTVEIDGFTLADHDEVVALWQRSGLRRRGIATALMDELERRLRERGALKAKLQVLEGNDVSLRFFARRGYEVETMCTPLGKELVAGGAPLDWSSSAKTEVGEESS